MTNDDGTPRKNAARECVDCAALPYRDGPSPWGQGRQYPTTHRPAKTRPIKSGATARSYRCGEHTTAHDKAARQRASDKRSRKRAGVDEATRQEVLAEQGWRCPCGAGLGGSRLNLSADHDHELARLHDHPEDVACLGCLAGFLCHHCNREVIGYLSRAGRKGNASRSRDEVADALVAIAYYLRNPPAARVHARRFATNGPPP